MSNGWVNLAIKYTSSFPLISLVPVCLSPSTWTCRARPRGSSRKWRHAAMAARSFIPDFQLDYKMISSGPAQLWATFPALPLSGHRGERSSRAAACPWACPRPFWGYFPPPFPGQGGHPFGANLARRLRASASRLAPGLACCGPRSSGRRCCGCLSGHVRARPTSMETSVHFV